MNLWAFLYLNNERSSIRQNRRQEAITWGISWRLVHRAIQGLSSPLHRCKFAR